MPSKHFCGSADHAIDRRLFLGGAATGVAAFAGPVGRLSAAHASCRRLSLQCVMPIFFDARTPTV